ncbi:hypothetical protein MtrunA17_Chr2g0277121 [Medicago truncatula]|uniref:Uncharacterized protein n=1 Tax=Medicago truncatula TaxID=3880 RepID=A0A396J258_MEDTR|nr:hypothetical protein MtrunA17_Chr2g0277121 [Medicago truncatula]
MKNVFFVYLKNWVLWFSKKLWCLYFFIFISSATKKIKSHDEPDEICLNLTSSSMLRVTQHRPITTFQRFRCFLHINISKD